MKKNLSVIGLLFCLFMTMLITPQAEQRTFTVEAIEQDGTIRLIDESNSYTAAMATYDSHVANSNNIQLREGNTIWKMKYGVVLFKQSETCDYNVTYTTDYGDGYTNGCYGIDGAYLETREEGQYIDFFLSGIKGSTTSDDVSLQPIETAKKVSTYKVDEGALVHQIKTQMSDDLYSTAIYLGEAPEYLSDGQEYYSYDGHYFYPADDTFSGFHKMIDDVRNNTHTNAVNANTPFFQYHQYLSHRSATNYREEEINSYFNDQLHIKHSLTSYRSIGTSYHGILTQSLLKDQAAAFLQYQDQFGVNAMMMLALSMNESATGRSYLAYTRNNLFGHAAFDSAVEENASRYLNSSKSIYSHAKHYLQESYLDPDSFTYHGGFFGNKASGMNVSYASDPYWGEKAAQYYVRLDEALGKKDMNTQSIGVITSKKDVKIYKDRDEASDVLYTTSGLPDVSQLILSEQGSWYKIQSDPAIGEEGDYDVTKSIGYVKKSDVDVINHAPEKTSDVRIPITFDANGGVFAGDEEALTLYIKEGVVPSILPPIKENYMFVGWNHEVAAATKATTYQAQYAKISSATLTTLPKVAYELNEQLDVSGGILTITLAQGENKEVPLTSEMVSGYDPEQTGTQTIQVTYLGAATDYTVTVSEEHQAAQAELLPQIQDLLQKYSIHDDLAHSTKETILSIKQTMNENGSPDLSRDGYRLLDTFIQIAYGNSLQVIISDDDTGLSVSGLSIATTLDSPSFLPQIIKFSLSKGISEEKTTLLSQVAQGNDYTLEYCFSLSGQNGFEELLLQDDLMLALPKPENAQLNNNYMILKYQDGEVMQIPASQTNTLISFTIDELGDYALVSRPTSNLYAGDDIIENNSVSTNGTDVFQYLIYIGIALFIIIMVIITIIVRNKRSTQNKKNPPKQTRSKKQRKSKQADHEEEPEEASFLRLHSIYADEAVPNAEDEE